MCRFTTLCRILAWDILISELSPACLTGISGCFFSLVFLFACFSFLCSLWLAFQVLPGPCNLHRPGGIPRTALGKGGKKKRKKKKRKKNQTLVDVSLALVHAPVLSCRHVTRSVHGASGYQLAAICYSWCGDINKLGFLEPSGQQRLIMYKTTIKRPRQPPVQHRSSQQDAQSVLHGAVVISHQRGQESCH